MPCIHFHSWDFGTGAGLYLDATADKWKQYRMYSYITQELPDLLRGMPELDIDNVSRGQGLGCHQTGMLRKHIAQFRPADLHHIRRQPYLVCFRPASLTLQYHLFQAGIMGHSMGGHGALTIALKNPSAYKSVSAFAPICNPTQVPWGQKALAGYLGEQWQEAAAQYDATELARQYNGPSLPVLMDTGTEDEYLKTQVCVCVVGKEVNRILVCL